MRHSELTVNTDGAKVIYSEYDDEDAPVAIVEANARTSSVPRGASGEDGGDNSDELSSESPLSAASSIPDEDIDFSLVYALHGFTATLEGQLQVDRGESMLLLDDSNSYWWLVKSMTNEKVGYIPAENIETPYERLARLNRHKNIVLSSSKQNVEMGPGKEDQRSDSERRAAMMRKVAWNAELVLPSPNAASFETDIEDSEDDTDEMEDGGSARRKGKKTTKSSEKRLNGGIFGKLFSRSTSRSSGTSSPPSPSSMSPPTSPSQARPPGSPGSPGSPASDTSPGSPIGENRIRIFPGNFGGVASSYKTFLATEEMTVRQLTFEAVQRFHLKDEDGVEYYLSLKVEDEKELCLSSEDKPLQLWRTVHATSPESPNSDGGYGTRVKILLNKRLRRVDRRKSRLIIKVVWYSKQEQAQDITKSNSQPSNPLRSTDRNGSLTRSSSLTMKFKKFTTPPPIITGNSEQTFSKVLSIDKDSTAIEVVSVALGKFSLVPDNASISITELAHHYYLTCIGSDQQTRQLDPTEKMKNFVDVNGQESIEELEKSAPGASPTSIGSTSPTSSSSLNSLSLDDDVYFLLSKHTDASTRSSEISVRSLSPTPSVKSLPSPPGNRSLSPVRAIQDNLHIGPTSPLATAGRNNIWDRSTDSSLASSVHTDGSGLGGKSTAGNSFDSDRGAIGGNETVAPRTQHDAMRTENFNTDDMFAHDEKVTYHRRDHLDHSDAHATGKEEDPTPFSPSAITRPEAAIDMVLSNGLERSSSFTLRATNSLDRGGGNDKTDKAMRPRMSLVLTDGDIPDIGEVEVDISDIIDDIIYGSQEPESQTPSPPADATAEGPQQSLSALSAPKRTMSLSLGQRRTSANLSNGATATRNASIINRPSPIVTIDAAPDRSLRQGSVSTILLPELPSPVPHVAVAASLTDISSTMTTTTTVQPRPRTASLSVTAPSSSSEKPMPPPPPQKDKDPTSPSSFSDASMADEDGSDMLDSLESYLETLKADLSAEKLRKLETALQKVKLTATAEMTMMSEDAEMETETEAEAERERKTEIDIERKRETGMGMEDMSPLASPSFPLNSIPADDISPSFSRQAPIHSSLSPLQSLSFVPDPSPPPSTTLPTPSPSANAAAAVSTPRRDLDDVDPTSKEDVTVSEKSNEIQRSKDLPSSSESSPNGSPIAARDRSRDDSREKVVPAASAAPAAPPPTITVPAPSINLFDDVGQRIEDLLTLVKYGQPGLGSTGGEKGSAPSLVPEYQKAVMALDDIEKSLDDLMSSVVSSNWSKPELA